MKNVEMSASGNILTIPYSEEKVGLNAYRKKP
jgi:hypothetical protein